MVCANCSINTGNQAGPRAENAGRGHGFQRGRCFAWASRLVLVFLLAGLLPASASAASEAEQTAAHYVSNGRAKYRSGDYAGAIADFTEVLRIQPGDIIAYISRGLAKSKNGDSDGAIADYTAAIAIHPGLAVAYNNRGSVRLGKGDYDGAIADFTEMIRIDPKDTKAYNNRGQAKLQKGDRAGAVADFTEVIRIDPQDAAAYYNRGNVKFSRDDYDGAMADYSWAVRINPRDAGPYYKRGLVNAKRGNYKSAIADYTVALKNNPRLALVYNHRGVAKFHTGDHYGAVVDYGKAIRLDPQFAAAYNNRAIAKHKKGDFDGAIADFTEAIRINPEDVEAYNNRANVKSDKGDFKGAIADYTEVIAIKPEGHLYANRGYLYYIFQRWTDALADFRKAYELGVGESGWDYVLLRIWLIRARTGDRQKATVELEDYLKKRQSTKADDWYAKISAYLLGKLPEEAFLKAAEDTDVKKANEQTCEATFYAGSARLIEGDRDGALLLFRQCIGTGVRGFTEYMSARAEIEALLIGIHVEPVDKETSHRLVLMQGVGVLVVDVKSGGPADRAGLRENDVISSIGGRSATLDRLRRVYELGKPGEEIELRVFRTGQKKQIVVTLSNWQ